MTITAVHTPTDPSTEASRAEAEKYRAYQDRLDGSWSAEQEWWRSHEGEARAQDLLHEEPARV